VDTLIASFLVTGSVSWLYYSDRMVEFPLGVFAIAMATVILPSLSQHHAEEAGDSFSDTLDWAMRWVVVVATPSALGLALLADPILTTLFQYGEFAPRDVHMASLSLVAYAIGLIGFMFIKVLAPGYFARQDMRTPVRVGIIALLANLILNLALVVPLKHAGLALATSLAAFINAGLLYRGLHRDGIHRPRPGWGGFVTKILFANLVMAAFLIYLRGAPEVWIDAELTLRIVRLTLVVVGGAAIYALCLIAVGIRPRHLRAPASGSPG
jgi:putative peptidoglycan lipid II flippase